MHRTANHANQLAVCILYCVMFVRSYVPCTQQLVKSTSVNSEMASSYTAILLVASHTKSESPLTHSIELICTPMYAIEFYATLYLTTC